MSLERAAEIRTWITGRLTRPVPLARVAAYARVAASWEDYRLRVHDHPLPADAERLVALTGALRELSAELGLATCTGADAGADGVPGCTDANGYLPGDPARLLCEGWLYATRVALSAVPDDTTPEGRT